MRDFYDILTLFKLYKNKINISDFKNAYLATFKNRNTEHLLKQEKEIIDRLEENKDLKILWEKYKKKYNYASNINFLDTILALKEINEIIYY